MVLTIARPTASASPLFEMVNWKCKENFLKGFDWRTKTERLGSLDSLTNSHCMKTARWLFDNFHMTGWKQMPHDYLKTAIYTVSTAWRLPNDWLTTGWSLSYNCLSTAWWLPNDYLMTAWDCLMTAWWFRDDCLMTAWWLNDEWMMTSWQLPDDCPTTAWRRLTENCLKNARKMPDECLMNDWWIPDKCLINAKLPVIPHWRPRIQITKWNLPNQLKARNAQAFEGVFLQHQIFPTLISILTDVELNFPGLTECRYSLIRASFAQTQGIKLSK